MRLAVFIVVFLLTGVAAADVKVARVPDGGIEPQAAIDNKGVIHLIYFKGPDKQGDIFYVTSADDGRTFSPPMRVNSQPGSAMAIGSVRGPQMALGREGRVHVAWMGSAVAEPKAPGKGTPMLYSRLADDVGGFQPQKNVIAAQPGLDGGGSIAADAVGHVYVAWHAPKAKDDGEQGRLMWLTKSSDDGKTFSPELSLSAGQPIGACACCEPRIAVGPGGEVFGLFRKADQMVNRGSIFFTTDAVVTKPATVREIAPMRYGACLLSTFALASTPDTYLEAYETTGELFLQRISIATGKTLSTTPAGKGDHPAMAVNAAGEILIARAVDTGWNRGGSIAWQVFDPAGKPVDGESGRARDLPVWGYPAVVAMPDGSFVVFY